MPSRARMTPRFTRASSIWLRLFFGFSAYCLALITLLKLDIAGERREHHEDDAEQPQDRRVHARASRRARSETSSRSASRMKFATIDEPP